MRPTTFVLFVLATFNPLAPSARAQSPEPDAPGELKLAPPSSAVPDAALRAMTEHEVFLDTVEGRTVLGRIAGFDASTVTMILDGSGEVVTIPRAQVTRLRAAPVLQPPALPSPEIERPVRRPPEPTETNPRYFALEAGITPSVAVDLDYGLFHAFANLNLVFPLATVNTSQFSSNRTWYAFSVGAGLGIPIAKSGRLKLDVFVHLDPFGVDGEDFVALGAGVGMHHTFANGFTLGFKVPFIGYAFRTNSTSSFRSSDEGLGFYYLSGAMGLPLAFFGYRF